MRYSYFLKATSLEIKVEFATTIIINKCDLVSPEELLSVKQAVKALNSNAVIIDSVNSEVILAFKIAIYLEAF
jgi:G3E family GTPase